MDIHKRILITWGVSAIIPFVGAALFTASLASTETPVSSPLRSLINERPAQPTELVAERTYSSKKFANPDGSYTLEAHVGHIFYKDHGQYLPIDETLHHDDARGGWTFTAHSFKPFIPDTCDGWIEFRDTFEGKDQTIKYRPKGCSGIQGRMVLSVPGLTNQNAVIYDDAFGSGYDLIIYFTRSSMKKVVRLRQGYPTDHDLAFDFEVQFPNASIYRAKSKSDIRANSAKVGLPSMLVGNDQTLIGDDKHDGQEWYTYLKPFAAWDNSGRSENITVNLYANAGKTYLQKIVPSSFLQAATGDVYTDTTNSYYSGAGDGGAGRYNPPTGAWSDIHDGGGTHHDNTATILTPGGFEGGGTGVTGFGSGYGWGITRAFIPVDTSTITDSATISAATSYLWANNVTGNQGTAYSYQTIVQTTQADTSQVQNSDYGNTGTTTGCTGISHGSIGTSDYTAFVLNATGMGWINKTGFTKLGIREGHDVTNNAPTFGNNLNDGVNWHSSESDNKDPYLSITFTVSPPLSPTDLLTNGQTNPTNVTSTQPVFSAVYNNPDTGDTSHIYQLQVSTSSTDWSSPVWDSGTSTMATTTSGNRSPDISYGGTPLAFDGSTYYWRIKFWNSDGDEGPYSTSTASFAMYWNTAPLAPTDLWTEEESNPTNVVNDEPKFSAVYNDANTEDTATYFWLQVSSSSTDWSTPLWDSNKTAMTSTANGSRCPDISFGGTGLALDGSTYYWRIKFWDANDNEGEFSTTASFTMSTQSLVAVRQSNKSISSSIAPVHDGQLLLGLEANKSYMIEGVIFATSTNATPDIKIAFSSSSVSSMIIGYTASSGDGQGQGEHSGGALMSLQSTGVVAVGANTPIPVQIGGTVTMSSAGGYLFFDWAQNSSNAAAVTVLKGSYLRAMEIQ